VTEITTNSILAALEAFKFADVESLEKDLATLEQDARCLREAIDIVKEFRRPNPDEPPTKPTPPKRTAAKATQPATMSESAIVSQVDAYLEFSGPMALKSLITGARLTGYGEDNVLACLNGDDRFQQDARGFWELRRIAEQR
jgi:hypothetical protein